MIHRQSTFDVAVRMRMTLEESRRRTYGGPAIFSFGFRPFFFGGALFAALAILYWLALFAGYAPGGGPADPLRWHIHEMIFGFFASIAAGFLLTAIPNWTGRLPVQGAGLAGLFALWLLGRVAMVLPWLDPAWAGGLDSLFLVAFAGVVWREILAGRNMRNLPVCLLITLLAAANVAFHFFADDAAAQQMVQRAALAVPALLIALIGGRIIPSFTRNWLVQRGETQLPAPAGRFDQLALGAAALALAAWVVAPLHAVTGLLFLVAGLLHAVRLGRWRGHRTGAEALVWILHVGYGWLVFALLLLGLAILAPHWVPPSAAVHALTAGAIGVMVLAVMTRATLGHTGQARTADGATKVIYMLVIAGAGLRVLGGLVPAAAYVPLLMGAGLLWSAAFAVFAWRYGPLFIRPR
jgi:uncharacterized protein involved in response to NO